MEELLICAVDENDDLAETLGTSKALLIFSEDFPAERIPFHGSPAGPILCRKNSRLFCGKIGMCLYTLLEDYSIRVVPGCSGKASEVIGQWRKGILSPSKTPFCSENGRTCGSCPGTY